MLFCWHSMYFSAKTDFSGPMFCIMNLFVHSIMYFYYALKSKKFLLPKIISVFITFIQLLQMFLGIYVLLLSIKCNQTIIENWHGIIYGFIMYSIYLILFFKILIKYFIK